MILLWYIYDISMIFIDLPLLSPLLICRSANLWIKLGQRNRKAFLFPFAVEGLLLRLAWWRGWLAHRAKRKQNAKPILTLVPFGKVNRSPHCINFVKICLENIRFWAISMITLFGVMLLCALYFLCVRNKTCFLFPWYSAVRLKWATYSRSRQYIGFT